MDTGHASILFVDDEQSILSSLKRLFRPTGHKIHTANSGQLGLDVLNNSDIDVVVSDMRMPAMDGAQFLAQVAERWPHTVRMLLTGYSDLSSAIDAVNDGKISRYLTKPWQDEDLLMCIEQAIQGKRMIEEKAELKALTAKQNEELKALNLCLEDKVAERTREIEVARQDLASAHESLKASYSATVEVFARLIQSRAGLGARTSIAQDASVIARNMGLDEAMCEATYNAALLCDIGKLSLPDESVQTPYVMLEAAPQREFHRHPVIAEASLLSIEPLAAAATIVRHHCEREDGTGFPDKLKGDAIPLPAKILSVAKAYFDLQDGRIVEEKLTSAEAIKFIVSQKGKRYDEAVVDEFVAWLGKPERTNQEAREKKLGLGGLRSRMKISRDLYDERGVLILAKGTVLSDRMIDKLDHLQKSLERQFVIYTEDQ